MVGALRKKGGSEGEAPAGPAERKGVAADKVCAAVVGWRMIVQSIDSRRGCRRTTVLFFCFCFFPRVYGKRTAQYEYDGIIHSIEKYIAKTAGIQRYGKYSTRGKWGESFLSKYTKRRIGCTKSAVALDGESIVWVLCQ